MFGKLSALPMECKLPFPLCVDVNADICKSFHQRFPSSQGMEYEEAQFLTCSLDDSGMEELCSVSPRSLFGISASHLPADLQHFGGFLLCEKKTCSSHLPHCSPAQCHKATAASWFSHLSAESLSSPRQFPFPRLGSV